MQEILERKPIALEDVLIVPETQQREDSFHVVDIGDSTAGTARHVVGSTPELIWCVDALDQAIACVAIGNQLD